MNKVTVIFKSGARVSFECKSMEIRKNQINSLIEYKIEGATKGLPMYMNMSQIDCIFSEPIEEVDSKLHYPEEIEEWEDK